ncbi:MAG: flavodoxin family protein [Eubacteriales bacterium]|nr:flavodoxin family protein [Eubacteriales bacterium]
MKVLAVYGSGHQGSSCNAMLAQAVKGARDAGHTVLEYSIYDMNIKGCTGCRACKEGGEQVCVVKDDLKPYFEELCSADVILLSAPNHTGQPCGPMITYLNRHYCLLRTDWTAKNKAGMRVAGFFSQGAPDPEAYRAVYQSYMADFQRRGMTLIDILIHAGREAVSQELLDRAYRLGQEL